MKALTVDARDKFRHALDAPVNPWLTSYVVILDAVKQARQAPESVRLDRIEHVCRQPGGVECLRVGICAPVSQLEASG